MGAPAFVPQLLLVIVLAGCEGKENSAAIAPAGDETSVPAWQETVKGLLFAGGSPDDIAGALRLVEKQARAGDPTAALWMGRGLLNDPPDRTGAAAWFLVAASSRQTASDAQGELDALALTPEERAAAEKEARALRSDSKKPPDLQP